MTVQNHVRPALSAEFRGEPGCFVQDKMWELEIRHGDGYSIIEKMFERCIIRNELVLGVVGSKNVQTELARIAEEDSSYRVNTANDTLRDKLWEELDPYSEEERDDDPYSEEERDDDPFSFIEGLFLLERKKRKAPRDRTSSPTSKNSRKKH